MAKKETPKSIQEVESAISTGAKALPKNGRVNIVDQDGVSYNVPASEVADHLQNGYQLEDPLVGAARDHVKKAGLTGAVGVAAGQFADEFLGGIPEIIYDKTQDPFEVAKKEAFKKEYELLNDVAGVAGFATSMLTPVGPMGLLARGASKAVVPLERALLSKLGALGVEGVTKQGAKQILANAAAKSAAMGVEGTLFAAPHALTEAALGDPEQAAETLAIGLGAGLALGAPVGMLGGVFKGLASKRATTAKKAAELAEKNKGVGLASPLEKSADEIGAVFGAGDDVLSSMSGAKVPDAQKLQDAADRLGIQTFEAMTSSSPVVRDSAYALSKSPSFAGARQAKNFDDVYRGLEQVQSNILGATAAEIEAGAGSVSRREAGDIIKEAVRNEIDRVRKPLQDAYGEIEQFAQAIPVDAKSLNRIAGNFKKEVMDGATSQQRAFRDRLASDLTEVKTLDGLKNFRTNIRNDLSATASNAERQAVSRLAEKIDRIYDNSIVRFALGNMKTPEALEKVMGLRALKKETDAGWAGLYRKMAPFKDVLGKRATKSPGAFLDYIESMPAEKLAGKLFTKENSRFLEFLNESFPDAFEAVKKNYLQGIAAKTSDGGRYNIKKFLNSIKGLDSPVKDVLFTSEQRAVLQDMATVIDKIPKNPNPSGTAYATELMEFNPFNPANVYRNAKDEAKYRILNSDWGSDGILAVEQAMKSVGKRLDEIPEMVNGMTAPKGRGNRSTFRNKISGARRGALSGSISGLNRALGGEASSNKVEALRNLQASLEEAAMNPEAQNSRVSQYVEALSKGGAPNVANAYAMNSSKAISYLYESLPKGYAPDVLSVRPFTPSDVEIAQFERKIQAVMDPLSAIDKLSDGTLTRDHVEALETVYPKLYRQVQLRVMSALADKKKPVPYQSRLKLSLLFQEDWEPSLSSIGDYQKTFMAEEQAPAPKKFDMENNLASDSQQLDQRKT